MHTLACFGIRIGIAPQRACFVLAEDHHPREETEHHHFLPSSSSSPCAPGGCSASHCWHASCSWRSCCCCARGGCRVVVPKVAPCLAKGAAHAPAIAPDARARVEPGARPAKVALDRGSHAPLGGVAQCPHRVVQRGLFCSREILVPWSTVGKRSRYRGSEGG